MTFFIHVSYRSRSQPLSYRSRELTIPQKRSPAVGPCYQEGGAQEAESKEGHQQGNTTWGVFVRVTCHLEMVLNSLELEVCVLFFCVLWPFLGCVCELHEPFKAKWTTWRRWGMLKIGVPHSIKLSSSLLSGDQWHKKFLEITPDPLALTPLLVTYL